MYLLKKCYAKDKATIKGQSEGNEGHASGIDSQKSSSVLLWFQ